MPPRYFNDTWIYDLDELKWASVGRPGGNTPSARGGCQLAVHGARLFLYGGHTVVADTRDGSERDVVHDDLWRLDLGSFQASQLSSRPLTLNPAAEHGASGYAAAAAGWLTSTKQAAVDAL